MPLIELSDDEWARLEPLLPKERGRRGRPGHLTCRRFVEAIFWVASTGAPWRALPAHYGEWNTVWRRFSRWSQAGVFDALMAVLAETNAGESRLPPMIGSTIVRAHRHAAGAKGRPGARPLAWQAREAGPARRFVC